MSFPRYLKYKASSVEWLGEVPAHWDVKPLKHVAWIDSCGSYGVEPEEAEIALPVATTAQIGSDGRFVVEQMPQRGFSPADVKRFGCSDGDILVVKSSGSATNIISGKAGLVDKSTPAFVFSNFLMRVRPMLDRASPKFIYAQLRSHLTRQRVELMCSTTTYPNLQIGQYTSAPLPIPPLAEQTLIAEFLDRETAKIDGLVAEQRRLMELLKEKRQAVISHAVTRGLNPHAPLKPSGIEWLGDVPAHWEVTKMKWVAKMESGHTPDKKIPEYWENGNIPWVSLNDTGYLKENDYISETAYMVTDLGIANSSAHLLPPRVVVFSRDATIGRCAITTRPMAVSQHFIAWVCGESIIPEFLLMRLRSMTRELDRLTTGATLKTIGMPEVRTIVTPVPPIKEQKAIIEWVSTETANLDTLTAEAQRATDLLQERRTALISAAITGQIDVRGQIPATLTQTS